MICGLRIAPSPRGVCSTRWSAATAAAVVLCVGQLSARRTAARLDCPMHDTLGRCSAPHWSQASRRARTIGARDLCQSKDIIKERQRTRWTYTRSKAGGRARTLEILCLRAPSSRFYAFESITASTYSLRKYTNFMRFHHGRAFHEFRYIHAVRLGQLDQRNRQRLRYYSMGRKVKSWSSLDRWPGDAKCSASVQQTRGEKYCQPKPKANGDRLTHESEVRRVLDSCRGTATSYCALQKTVLLAAMQQQQQQQQQQRNRAISQLSVSRREPIREATVRHDCLKEPASLSKLQVKATRQRYDSTRASSCPPASDESRSRTSASVSEFVVYFLEYRVEEPRRGTNRAARESCLCSRSARSEAVLEALAKCSKLTEVLGDVLELACGQPASQQANSDHARHESGSSSSPSSPATATNAASGGGGGAGTGASAQAYYSGAGSSVTSSSSASSSTSASSRIGAITGVAIIRSRWTQRQSRVTSSASSSAHSTQDSQDSQVSSELLCCRLHYIASLCAYIYEWRLDNSYTNPQVSSCFARSISTRCNAPLRQLQHQCSRSSSGSRMSLATRAMTSLSRRPSQGSQEQLPINEQQQQQQPQIRTFDPDGRHHNHELLHAASSYPPSRGSRSPSPVRAASLDARCSSPLGQQASLLSAAQLAASQPGLASASSSQAASQAPRSPAARCLSPLMIPSPRASFSLSTDGGLPPASPLGALQPDLYQRRDQPLFLSRGSGKSLGRLRLRLSYDFDKSDLDVHLVEASELASGEHGGFQDPFVKLSLSPEVDARKRQTGVHHNEANPRFDQHFKFPVSQDELQDKTLLLQVLDDDRFSRNDVVGSLRVALDGLDISSRGGVELWGEVSRERKPPEEKQEVCLSLSYLPQAGRLAMTLHKARNLFPLPGKQSLDAFVKVGLISGEKRVKKKKTSVRKATRCPDWNEAFTFSVAQSALATSAIEICVLDSSSQESSSGHAVIGSCIVGPGLGQAGLDSGTSNPSVEHWQLMIQSPRENITMWHTLH
ncbi:unnamed protein product [Trichogramma brassicae]|uniref:C2 domain-containing protein n=1 Tax=Trichogramma brassicae TaxID=86971 RepID=A0A6H5I7V5_9HYME|nr:unnamed protein product [Trichogramma brassicae]